MAHIVHSHVHSLVSPRLSYSSCILNTIRFVAYFVQRPSGYNRYLVSARCAPYASRYWAAICEVRPCGPLSSALKYSRPEPTLQGPSRYCLDIAKIVF